MLLYRGPLAILVCISDRSSSYRSYTVQLFRAAMLYSIAYYVNKENRVIRTIY